MSKAVERVGEQLAAVERQVGGRLGVAMLDSGSGWYVGHRSDERFPMCSTYKFLASAAVLRRVDEGAEQLARTVPFGARDLLGYAPITKAHVEGGGMALGDLCAASIEWSDNTAGNLLLAVIGGPAGLTRYARSLGDSVTRLDRDEPTLNTATPGDDRDTTSPRSMLHDMRLTLLGSGLSPQSRRQLQAWMLGDQVGGRRLRAGLPQSWRIGDKTGSGAWGTANTLGVLFPPGRPTTLVAVYCTGSSASADALNAAHAEVARILVGVR